MRVYRLVIATNGSCCGHNERDIEFITTFKFRSSRQVLNHADHRLLRTYEVMLSRTTSVLS